MPSSAHSSPTLVPGLPIAACASRSLAAVILNGRPRSAAGPCRGQAGLRALDDQRVLELGQRGENAEHETAVCRGGVELRALARQDLQADLAPGQIMDEVD